MTLEQAMAIIARVQDALVSNGFSIGAWGPCSDGVDGRWGPDTRTGWGAAMSASGYSPTQTTALLATLGVGDVSGTQLQTAINAWNQWRSKQEVGSVAYEVAANSALAAATGITPETCPPPPETAPTPVTPELYDMAPVTEEGIPWWLWLVLGLVLAAAAGGGIWYWHKYKKSRRRKKKSKGMNGYSSSFKAGPELTEEEFGGGEESEDDEYT